MSPPRTRFLDPSRFASRLARGREVGRHDPRVDAPRREKRCAAMIGTWVEHERGGACGPPARPTARHSVIEMSSEAARRLARRHRAVHRGFRIPRPPSRRGCIAQYAEANRAQHRRCVSAAAHPRHVAGVRAAKLLRPWRLRLAGVLRRSAKLRFTPKRSTTTEPGGPAPSRAAASAAAAGSGIGARNTSSGTEGEDEDGGSFPTCGPVTAATRSRLCLKLAHICMAGWVASYFVVPPSFHVSTDIHCVLPPPAWKPTLPRYLTETSMSKTQWGRNTGVNVGRGLSPSRGTTDGGFDCEVGFGDAMVRRTPRR